jgi:phospholipid/cholesterol/gamma-HCH transport system substrate-binding protein
MKTYTRDALTGLTAIAGLLGLATTLMLFGELRGLSEEFFTFHLRLDSARGLLSGGPVTISGVRSGEVAKVENAADPTKGVELEIRMKEGAKVPKAFEVHIDQSLVGDATLELTPVDDPALAGQYIAAGETVERKALTMMDDIAGQLAEPIAAINQTAQNFEMLTATYDEVGKRVSGLLEARTVEDVAGGKTPTIPSTLARIDSAVAGADRWLGDAELQAEAKGLVKQAADAVHQWKATGQAVDREAAETGDRIAEAAAGFNATVAALGESADEIREAAHSLNSGRGTLGMLLVNPDLYRALQSAAERLDRALVEAQLLIEKYRKEGVPIQF